MNKSSGSTHVVVTVTLAVALVIALGFVFWQNFIHKEPVAEQPVTTPAKTKTTEKTETIQTTAETGTVTGQAIYPSEGYPNDYKACLLNAQTKAEIICDNAMAGKIGDILDWKVTVTPGEYLAVAKVGSELAYYDGFMKDANYEKSGIDLCKAEYHTPLTITVEAGKTLSGINVGNFYYVPQNC